MNVIILPKNLGPEPAKESLAGTGKSPRLLSLSSPSQRSFLNFCKKMELGLKVLFLLPHLVS